jgi:hypothetical protein
MAPTSTNSVPASAHIADPDVVVADDRELAVGGRRVGLSVRAIQRARARL